MPTSDVKLCELRTSNGSFMVPYEVHRRKGMRHLRVLVDDSNRVQLKVPYRISEAAALKFLRSQGEWVVKTLERTPRRITLHEHLVKQKTVSARGRDIPLEMGFRARELSFLLHDEPERVEIALDPQLEIERQLRLVLQAFAREVVPERVKALAKEHDLRVKRVTIRDQRTRWGACTDRSTLSLNWRLVLLTAALQDHVILHELAHLKHLDHSKKFWNLLRELDPACDRHDRALTKVSRALMQMGR